MAKKLGKERLRPKDNDGALQNFQLPKIRKGVNKIQVRLLDLFRTRMRQTIPYIYDTFTKKNNNFWIFPKKADYDYGMKNGLWFSGDAENTKPIHSKFPWSSFGTTIAGEISGDPGKCSDHFIMISSKPQLEWSMGSSKDAVKFAWNCDELSIFPMGSSKTRAITTGCRAASREQKFQVQMERGGISFYSTNCKESAASISSRTQTKQLRVNNPFANNEKASLVYIYIGASQDRKQVTKKPVFKFVKVLTAGLGLQELEVIGRNS